MDVYNHHKVDFRTDHGIPWGGIAFALVLLVVWLSYYVTEALEADCRKDAVIAGLDDEDVARACEQP